jgi:hypothetical protein
MGTRLFQRLCQCGDGWRLPLQAAKRVGQRVHVDHVLVWVQGLIECGTMSRIVVAWWGLRLRFSIVSL